VPRTRKGDLSKLQSSDGEALQTATVFVAAVSAAYTQTFVPEEELTTSETALLATWRQVAELTGGVPRVVKSVVVAESINPSGAETQPAGLWSPKHGRIIICRAQLRSPAAFFGILIHELTHARTGFPDVDRGFETALTSVIGVLAAQMMANKGGGAGPA
jgi:hypothetical protein